jgi:hypothetical protein
MFQTFFKFVEVAGGPDPVPAVQKKIEILTGVIINFIPNPDERARLKEKRKTLIHDAHKKYKDTEDLNDAILEINSDIIGQVMELCDDFLAIMERQSVMATMDNAELSRIETKFYPDGLPKPGAAKSLEDNEDEVIEEV